MAEEIENHTVRLLQELRADMGKNFAEMRERFDGIDQRLDGNTLLLNMVAGIVHDHEQRIDKVGSTS